MVLVAYKHVRRKSLWKNSIAFPKKTVILSLARRQAGSSWFLLVHCCCRTILHLSMTFLPEWRRTRVADRHTTYFVHCPGCPSSFDRRWRKIQEIAVSFFCCHDGILFGIQHILPISNADVEPSTGWLLNHSHGWYWYTLGHSLCHTHFPLTAQLFGTLQHTDRKEVS